MSSQAQSEVHLPRIAIKFCTQCKWNLRAAYYAQELLQTFSTTLGEVSLIPVTGGIFTVIIYHSASGSEDNNTSTSSVQETLLWDRKSEGGFPETKEIKNRVRNIVEPNRDLGHIDRSLKKGKKENGGTSEVVQETKDETKGEVKNGKDSGVGSSPLPLVGEKQDGKEKAECEDCK